MAVTKKDVVKVYIALFGRAPEGEGLDYWYEQANNPNNDWTLDQLADAMYNAALQYEDYANLSDYKNLVEAIYENVLGKTYDDDPKGIDYWVSELKKGNVSPGEVASKIIYVAETYYPEHSATKTLENRTEVALYAAEKIKKFDGNFDLFKSIVKSVTDDANSIENAKKMIDNISTDLGNNLTLTVGKDVIIGTEANDVIYAPIEQSNGSVFNTLESGDVIKGEGGIDTLKADITYSQNTTIGVGIQAISPIVEGVEKIEFRTQYSNDDFKVNQSHIDAENIKNAAEYWHVNGRSNLKIEDIRQLPEDIKFGVKNTDPWVGTYIYFDPEQLAGDRVSKYGSKLIVVINDTNSPELENIKVSGIKFTLDGKEYVLRDPNDEALGSTYNDFVNALQNLISQNEELKDRLVVKYLGDGKIEIVDTKGGEFTVDNGKGGLIFSNGEVPAQGNIQWGMSVGNPIEEQKPIETELILDNVGRTSQGGAIDIGSMGEGGIEVFNVKVAKDSWISELHSRENFGFGKDHIETVNLSTIKDNQHLYIGDSVDYRIDGRLEKGLTDVREVLNKGFNGELKYGVSLTDNSIDKYLNAQTSGQVLFKYEGGNKNDIIVVTDDSTGDTLSSDKDFAMFIDLGSGDDRLVLDVPVSKQVEVKGGEGEDSIVVSNSHGEGNGVFKTFEGFEIYEIEAEDNTTHNFTSIPVKEIYVATDRDRDGKTDLLPVDTTLKYTPKGAKIVITGKNQTAKAETSNGNQNFGDISILSANVPVDTKQLDIILENTARLDGKLSVDKLIIGDDGSNISNVDKLVIESSGKRSTSNVVKELDAARVSSIKFEGSQALSLNLKNAANDKSEESLTVDSTDLHNKFKLYLNADILTRVNHNTDKKDVTVKANDNQYAELYLYGSGADVTSNTTISDFDILRFGDDDHGSTSGSYNLSKFINIGEYQVYKTDGDITLTGLGNEQKFTVNMDQYEDNNYIIGTVNFVSAQSDSNNSLIVNLKDFDKNQDIADSISLKTQDFGTLVINVEDNGRAMSFDLNIEEDIKESKGNKKDLSSLIIKGGSSTETERDSINLESKNIDNESLKYVDVSNFDGVIKGLKLGTTTGENNISVNLNKWGGYIQEINDNDTEDAVVSYNLSTNMAKNSVWGIAGFENGDGSGNNIPVTDKSVLLLDELGIDNITDLDITRLASTKVFDDGSGNYFLNPSNNTSYQDNKLIVAVEFLDNKKNVKKVVQTRVFDKDKNGDNVATEQELGLDLNNDGELDGKKGLKISVDDSKDLDGDNNNDNVYYIEFDGNYTILPDIFDPASNNVQALELITPNDQQKYSFNVLLGVTDAGVPLSEDFINGL